LFGPIWIFAGVLLLVAALLDALWTTLTVSRAGFLSNHVAGCVGRVAMRGPAPIAENAAILALCVSFVMWAVLFWAGWTMVFCGSTGAVVSTTMETPASAIDRVYFTGFTLTTLGIGDFKPGQSVWKVATVLAAASGFVVLTLFVTYALTVMSALNQRRLLGTAVAHMGPSAEAIVGLLGEGGRDALSTRLADLTNLLELAQVQADAYPVLEYSHATEHSFVRAVVTLGEVSLLLEHVVHPSESLPAAVWMPLRRAVNHLVGENVPSQELAESPLAERPDFEALERCGVRAISGAEQAFEESAVQEMRRRWAAWLQWHGQTRR
jgi:hypothetical protein